MPRQAGAQRGAGHFAVVGLIVLLLTAAGWYVLRGNRQQAAREQAATTAARQPGEVNQGAQRVEFARTDKEQILVALNQYCKNQYKRFWENTYRKSFDDSRITSGYDDSVPKPFVIDGNFALVRAAKCDTGELTEAQKFAPFMLYFNKQDKLWTAKERYQTTPPCQDFAGETWPVTVLEECADKTVQ